MSQIADEFLRANPPTEFWDGYTAEFASAEAERFVEWTEKENIGYYASKANAKLLQDWLEINSWPITFRNLRISYYWCKAEELLESVPAESDELEGKVKYTGPTAQRILKSPGELEAERTETARLRALDANSARSKKKVSVGEDLRRAYQQSLQENKNGGRHKHMSLGEARSYVSGKFPELKVDSPSYNEWVSRMMFSSEE